MTRVDRLLLALALAVPWLFIWQGLDFTDQGYLVTGYRCFLHYPEVTEDSGHMWLTNLVGGLWDAAFGRLGLISMRALWALCLSGGLLLAFRLARKLSGARAAALGALVASVFLSDRRETWFSYNTSSSLLFVAAIVCLVYGLTQKNRRTLLATGVLLGFVPFARFPNVLALSLAATLGLAAWLDPPRRRDLPRDVAVLALGCVGGVLCMLALIALRGDWALYFDGLHSLFAPSMQQAGYDSDSLVGNFLTDQALALGWGVAVCAVGAGLARVMSKLPALAAWLLVALVAGVSIWGIASASEPWRWVVPGTVCVLLAAIALGLWQRSFELRIAAFAALVIVLVAPLGSNNGIKNAHMGLWLALPLVLAGLLSLEKQYLAGQGAKLATVACLVLAGEGLHRAATYTYRDSERSRLTAGFDHPQLRGQFTSAERARSVSEVLTALEGRVSPGDYLLASEGTPLLQYLTKTRPYLNRPWLMGWERGHVVAALAKEAPRRTGCLPVAVLTTKSTRGPEWPRRPRHLENRAAQRGVRAAIKAFLRAHGYERTWSNGFFQILQPPDQGKPCR
jgi:hypothetical protein